MDSQSEKAEREESRLQFNKQLFKTYLALDHWHRFRLRLFLEGILVGIAGGLLIALFRFLLGLADTYRRRLFQEIIIPSFGISDFLPLLGWLAALFFIGGALYGMCRYAPMASGSGIPQVKGVILGFFKMKWFRILWVKITAGALGIGAGLSLGREGPSIQIGAVAAQGLSRLMGRTRMEERYLITSGASAGLAAAFNAPLAGTMFALEELHRNFSGAVLLPTMASAISATIVSQFFFGSATSFSFPLLVHLPSAIYGLPVFRNQYMKIMFALFAATILAFTLPDVLGGGNFLVDSLAKARYGFGFLAALLLAKFLFTLISYGCGVPGGFFLPLLVIGALIGSLEGELLISAGILSALYLPNIIIIAMVAFFAASIRAPITGTLLILEMTGDFHHLTALALASAVAYVTAELLKGQPIYDSLLKKSLSNDSTPVSDEERNILEVPVGSGSILENRTVEEIPRLSHTVLVNIKRQGADMIPDPDTKLLSGDFLYFLTESRHTEEIHHLCEAQIPKDHIR